MSRKRSSPVGEDGGGLTPALVDQLVEALQKPLPRRFAALHCGVSPKTFERWLQDGASGAGSGLAVDLARRVYQWEAQDVGEEMRHLKTLAAINPQATKTYLELMHPADFGGFVRTAPDEFERPDRQKRTRGHLLDNPPPRMLADFKAHDWFRMPKGISKRDRSTILKILTSYERKQTAALLAADTDPSRGGETDPDAAPA